MEQSPDWIQRAQALQLCVRNFVDGRWHDVGGTAMDKFGPRDGSVLCRFGSGDARDVDVAVASARRAFEDGRWAGLPAQRRKDTLLHLASLLFKHREEFALLECLDVGKPIRDALTIDVPMAAAILRYNAEAADKMHAKVYAVDASSLSYQLRRPFGVTAGIIGWNFPLVLAAMKIGPALATGNSLVLKPSEVTSFSAARVAELALEAGVPEGVLNVIHGGSAVGGALAIHPDVDLLSFTGSTQTGKKLLVASGQSNMKRLILECGGKAPNIVFDDCPDLDAVAEAVVARAFWNQGQVCTASSRLLLQESIKDELLPRLVSRVAEMSPSDPLRMETRFGALVTAGHKQKILHYIDNGKLEGAKLIHHSPTEPPHATGFYVAPAIFDQVSPEHKLAREEIFGPVLSVMSFRNEEEAVRLANGTIYGLSAILWTRDLRRAHRMTQGIRAGRIVVNATATPTGGPKEGVVTVGGHKESGLGVEGGIEGLEAYMTNTAAQLFV